MKLENTHAVVEFIFKGIKPPYMVLGQELCMMLLTPDGRVVKKPNNPIINQFLKVLKPIFWDQCPTMIGPPYDLRPIPYNTLVVDDNLSMNILNPTSNYMVCPMWMVEKIHDQFLIDLIRYFQVLIGSGLPIPHFVRSNPKGERFMKPKDYYTKNCTFMQNIVNLYEINF